jgi:hypothetical protein
MLTARFRKSLFAVIAAQQEQFSARAEFQSNCRGRSALRQRDM